VTSRKFILDGKSLWLTTYFLPFPMSKHRGMLYDLHPNGHAADADVNDHFLRAFHDLLLFLSILLTTRKILDFPGKKWVSLGFWDCLPG
jgi:hypothetical protein